MTTPQLYSANGNYQQQLMLSIRHANRRILLETMVLDQVGAMNEVVTACLQACKRGVEVIVIYDIFSYQEMILRYGVREYRAFMSRLNDMEHAGATIYKVGAHSLNPFAGRHHAKAVIIDDHAYIGGGVNLTAGSFQTHDFMLRYDDAVLTQILCSRLPQAALRRERDQVVYHDDDTEILFDAGNKRQSLIYDRLCELAQQSTKVWYVSKLAPDGQLVHLLQQKNTQYWYNSLSSAGMFDKVAIFIDQVKVRVLNNYKGTALLHAKFCVFQLPDGTYEAVTGSHNFNSRGVNFGTQELAVHTKDQALCEQLITFAATLS